MKVSAIISDDLENNIKAYTNSSAITIVLKDWVNIHIIKELNKMIGQSIVDFNRAI